MRARLLLAVVSLALALGAGELTLRAVGYYGVRGAELEKLRLVDDPVVDYRRIPDLSWVRDGKLYEINSRGWRDREHTLDKPPGQIRILSIGDSVTNGYGVEGHEIYSKRLGAALNEAEPDAARFEVILTTQGAMNTEQEVHLIAIEGLLYDPDLILLGYVLNDPAAGASLRRDRELAREATTWSKVKEQAQRSSLVHLAYRSGQRILWRWRSWRGAAEVAAYATDDSFERLHRNPRSWGRVTGALDRLASISRERDVPVLVVIFPVLYELQNYRWASIHRQVEQAVVDRGLWALDLLPAFREFPPRRLQFVEGDHIHPNAFGHQVAADAIRAYLDELGWPQRSRSIPTPASTNR